MITASLLRRGLEMEDAFSISRLLRDQIGDLTEITSADLLERTRQLVLDRIGVDLREQFEAEHAESETRMLPLVRSKEGVYPFSKGILLRQLVTAGLEIDPAAQLSEEVEAWAAALHEEQVDDTRVEGAVMRRLLRTHGAAVARRYRFTSWLRKAPQPVIILIGGATGIGKSTVATELAYRLGVRSVTSTDMIRETMRTVLPAQVVPGLHDHSFRGMLQGGKVLSNPRERVLAGFHQQVEQVAVGIRAVIRRAIRENSHMIIEGIHLRPPFGQYMPLGTEALYAGLVLALPEEHLHRGRFPRRAKKQNLRDPNPYLDAFQSVRWIHDDLLGAAEDSDALVVNSEEVGRSIRSVVDYLSVCIPHDDSKPMPSVPLLGESKPDDAPRTLFLILDGLADEPNPALDYLTPLAAADTPTFDVLAELGGQGLVVTGHDPEVPPSTDQGLLALLGKDAMEFRLGRGLLEALGQGLPLMPGSIVFRGNLATEQADGMLVDRRAGRIRAGVGDLLKELSDVPLIGGVRGFVYPGHEHRTVVMLKGSGLSPEVSDSDPGGEAAIQRRLRVEALDGSPEAARTAAALEDLLTIASRVLSNHRHNEDREKKGLFPANCIITRGAASVGRLPQRSHSPAGSALISGCATALGVARLVGMQAATTPEMTGNLDTDVAAKFRQALEMLKTRHFVAVHVKGTDIASHDQRPLEKRTFIERIDKELGLALRKHSEVADALRVVVSADHGTSCITGNHMTDPVPVLISTWQDASERGRFDEESAEHGALGLIGPGELAQILWTEHRPKVDQPG